MSATISQTSKNPGAAAGEHGLLSLPTSILSHIVKPISLFFTQKYSRIGYTTAAAICEFIKSRGSEERSNDEYIQLLHLFINRIKDLKLLDCAPPTPLFTPQISNLHLRLKIHNRRLPNFPTITTTPSNIPNLKTTLLSLSFTQLPEIYLQNLTSLTLTPFPTTPKKQASS
ncbi:hypothetical protein TWF225_006497 [Orbilia oligospora]|nr:hypothetical protein TWF225_006497 [Orbilia oligospora]KAF3265008.1 hypothetical protein TWF217_002660 [Orbilia oligospora]KAF3268119.1 hypothetical protein TWF128_008130 [Orbilia oligospora]